MMQSESTLSYPKNYHDLLMVLPIPIMVMEVDKTISFINPAFEKAFGWKLEEIKDRLFDFIPENELIKTATGKFNLITGGELNNFETKRFAKDGRLLDVIYDGARIYNAENCTSGLIIALKDITKRKRAEFINQSLYQISNALHRYHILDDLLKYISQQARSLLEAGRAHVMLLNEQDETFYFRAEDVDDTDKGHKYENLVISANRGVTGEVRRTRKPIIVNDYVNNPLAEGMWKQLPILNVRNLLQVPILIEEKLIGILCAVNKKKGEFDERDVKMLETIAGVVALPIENARINNELHNSYIEIKSLNKAKDSIIDRLSHELHTPLAVIKASLHLLKTFLTKVENNNTSRILKRVENNLNRLIGMQYQLNDISKNSHFLHGRMLSHLLELCINELENLICLETGEPITDRIRKRIESIYVPREVDPEKIDLGFFVDRVIKQIMPAFSHRRLELMTVLQDTGNIYIPAEVLEKIVVGLVKNAVEYTPDGGKIEIKITRAAKSIFLDICDSGIGITEENKKLLFHSYFTTSETYNYSTGKPYDFNAGGRGFELLRIKIFSERYNFKIHLTSNRCPFIPANKDLCKGNTSDCRYLANTDECARNGGTIFSIEFPIM